MDLSDLPDELQPTKGPTLSPDEREQRLKDLGSLVAGKIDDAVKARKESGIEEVWSQCEDAYLGIDDSNRHEYAKAKWAKSTTMQGPLTSNRQPSENKSTAYVRLTTRYVDMGAAKISEIVLPIDDKAFTLDATPVPQLVKSKDDQSPLMVNGQQGFKPADGPPGAAMVPAAVKDAVEILLEQASQKAKKAERRIYDWMVESRYPMQMRKVIHDSARIGVGILKGPFPDLKEGKSFDIQNGVGVLQIVHSISPTCKWIDPWNFFPARSCGEDVHEGDGIAERDFLSPSSLKALKDLTDQDGSPIYLSTQIDKVIEEGPDKCNTEQGRNPNELNKPSRFTVWNYTGTLSREDMVVLNAPGADELPADLVECFCILTVVNDTIIRASFNPLEKTGNFPYRVFPWSRRAGHWAGVGIGEQVSLPQRMVNAATRGWMNNAGKTAGAQIVMDSRAIVPADNNWEITPDKLWFLTGEATDNDVRKVFMSVEFPDRAQTLQAIIQYAFKMAEEMSNIPLISQGQAGKDDPQTFGQAELQNTNANTLLRDKAYSLDDCVTEPLVNDFYEWLLLDPDVPEEEKGDFQINARGSVAMVEKAIQEQTLAQLLPLSLNPVWGQDPKKLMGEFLRSKRINPDTTKYTDAELAKMQSVQPPPPPQVQVAQINAQAKLQATNMELSAQSQQSAAEMQHEQQMLATGGATPQNASAMARIEAEKIKAQGMLSLQNMRSQTELTYAQTEAQMARDNAQADIQKMEIQREIALLNYANQQKISLDNVKAQLAKSAMDNQTKRELASAEIALAQSEGDKQRAHDLHKHENPSPSLVRDQVSTDKTP
jgi:hypothetical protein